ncbi:hypothetical protein NDU88_002777 [Pleurodeles waltl]|uniref:Uncharacterized protein n=1 Tax=Pleurodeles waltl TaxID=8319 RepID=A0AAV7M4D2_PLEWA|nr:hypothetical protein NDU88_002777 [Pleurodeles waltl]
MWKPSGASVRHILLRYPPVGLDSGYPLARFNRMPRGTSRVTAPLFRLATLTYPTTTGKPKSKASQPGLAIYPLACHLPELAAEIHFHNRPRRVSNPKPYAPSDSISLSHPAWGIKDRAFPHVRFGAPGLPAHSCLVQRNRHCSCLAPPCDASAARLAGYGHATRQRPLPRQAGEERAALSLSCAPVGPCLNAPAKCWGCPAPAFGLPRETLNDGAPGRGGPPPGLRCAEVVLPATVVGRSIR